MNNTVTNIIQLGTEATQHTIAQYTQFQFADAVTTSICFLVGALCALCVVFNVKDVIGRILARDRETQFLIKSSACIVFVVLCVSAARQIPTIINPEAAAIHQLISNIR